MSIFVTALYWGLLISTFMSGMQDISSPEARELTLMLDRSNKVPGRDAARVPSVWWTTGSVLREVVCTASAFVPESVLVAELFLCPRVSR